MGIPKQLQKLAAECRLMGVNIPNLINRARIHNGEVVALDLSKCDIGNFSHFPVTIAGFTTLRSLDLSDNNLHQLPEDILSLNRLEYLDVSHNHLREIEEHILQLPELKSLRARENHINKVYGPQSPSQLRRIDLAENNLQEIPLVVREMRYLEHLNLSDNQIADIDNEIKLPQLTYLNLRANALKTIPDYVFELEDLYKLNLYANPIEISATQFRIASPKLKIYVDRRVNRHRASTGARVIQLTNHIMDYRFSQDHHPHFGVTKHGKPLLSTVIFGDVGVGKRSIVESFIYDNFIPERKLSIELNRYFNWDHFIYQKSHLMFQVWYLHSQFKNSQTYDTNMLNGFYYSRAIVLVFDLTDAKSFRKIPYYFKQIIQVRTALCPIIVVGNKKDKGYQAIDSETIQNTIQKIEKRLGTNIPYIETSVTKNQNIATIFDTLYEMFDK